MLKSSSKNSPIAKTFDIYISKVLKQVHTKISISSNAKSQINYLLLLLASKIIEEASSLTLDANRKTLDTRSIQTAVRNIFGFSELEKYSISEATKAVIKYNSYYRSGNSKKRIKRSELAGLQFPISRVENIIKNKYKGRISETCSVYLTAVIEYISAEILELAGNSALDNKRSMINSRDLMLAIKNDEELTKLTNTIDFEVMGGGVIKNVNSLLLKSKKTIKKKSRRRVSRSKRSRRRVLRSKHSKRRILTSKRLRSRK